MKTKKRDHLGDKFVHKAGIFIKKKKALDAQCHSRGTNEVQSSNARNSCPYNVSMKMSTSEAKKCKPGNRLADPRKQ